jgi:hypothetical protein
LNAIVAVVALALLSLCGCKRSQAAPQAGASSSAARANPIAPLRVVMTHDAFKLDGELNEPPWNAVSARTGAFLDGTGGEARPYSEARFLWDAENLYVALYAADDNIRATVTQHDGPVWIDDAFALELTSMQPLDSPTYHFDISAAGVVTDAKRIVGAKDDVSWESGIQLGVDKDGTLNDPTDMDEEWVIEAKIPLKSLGLEPKPGTRVAVAINRCDTPRNTKEKRCGAWGTPKDPRVLELAP